MSHQTNALPTAVAGSSAEAQAAAFSDDPRIHFDRASGTWRFEDDDDNEFEYDAAKGAWVPLVSTSQCLLVRLFNIFYSRISFLCKVDEDLVKAQQAAYSIAGVDEEVRFASPRHTS